MLSRLVLALVLTAAASASYAGPPEAKPKTRTLAELIELAMREGRDDPLTAATATELSLGTTELPYKKLWYKQSTTPDKQSHIFGVLYRSEGERVVPTDLVLSVGAASKVDGKISLYVTSYHSTLSGVLKGVSRAQGLRGEMTGAPVKLDASLRKGFKSELDFHRVTVPKLGLEFVK
ncbi:MAG: hypothetical protein HY553_16040 [Elusimicrobia bacterium]|nr:hypothetical protein [Elusimicrobiota bacterium]